RLRLHQRYAHGRGGDLVLADGDPGAAEPRVPQANAAEDRDQEEADCGPVHEADEVHVCALLEDEVGRHPKMVRQPPSEAGRVDRIDARRAVREIEAQSALVAVPGHRATISPKPSVTMAR